MNPLLLVVIGALVLVLVIIALSAIRVVQQYERGVIEPVIQMMRHQASAPVHEPLNGSRLSEPSMPR